LLLPYFKVIISHPNAASHAATDEDFMLKRLLAPVLTLLLLVGVSTAIYLSVKEQASLQAPALQELKGIIGSEKEDFFRDPETVAALAKAPWHLHVSIEKSGSRELSTTQNLKNQYDFAFPAGIAAAEKLKREQNGKKAVQLFFSPMVIASWRPIADLLVANHIAQKRGDTYYIVDMQALFSLISHEQRWRDLPGNTAYPVNKAILVTTTDLHTSNSAAMYLALASYLLNGNAIVENTAQIDKILPQLSALFSRQGFTENSTEIPFQDYLTMGMGKSPLVMVYESQFFSAANKSPSAITPEMVLLYPEPTLFSKHILIPLTANGETLAAALEQDETLQQIAQRYGFRTAHSAANSRTAALPSLVNVIDEPSYDILEAMINRITAR
jgi:hypothetical protein